MSSDVETFLARVGQADLPYRHFSVPEDVQVAARFPLLKRLLSRDAPAPEAAATQDQPS